MASNSAIYCAFSDDNCDLSCVFDADFRSCFLNGILTRSWALWKTEKWVLDAEINFWYTHATLKWIFFLHTVVLSHRAPATGQGRPYRTDRSDFTDHILERLRKYNSINYSLFFWYKFGLQSPRVRNKISTTMPTLDFCSPQSLQCAYAFFPARSRFRPVLRSVNCFGNGR